MASLVPATGGCLCGKTRYSCQLKNHNAHACHCSMCRKHGGIGMAVEVELPIAFENDAKPCIYRSSDWAERIFCTDCGSWLAWQALDASYAVVSAGSLDDQSALTLKTQIFIDDKPAYYNFAENTETMTGKQVMAAFSADGHD